MLNVRPVTPAVVGYFLRQGPGRWIGSGAAELGLRGDLAGADLGRVLRGRHPHGDHFLPAVRPARRRAGWDLIFSAPKSLSLVAASQERIGSQVEAAHAAAVEEAVELLEDSLAHVNDAVSPGGRSPACGVTAAAFDHTRNAGGEPHLHTHLLLVNLARRADGRWLSLAHWWLERRQLDAVYGLGLRHHLSSRGIELEWRVRPDGLVDVAGVPRAAVQVASTRTHESLSGARYTGRGADPERPWRDRTRAAGWEPDAGARIEGRAESRHRAGDTAAAVTDRLALKGSTFGRRDVLIALAAQPCAAFTAREARAWVDAFLSGCERVPGDNVELWTSALARSADRRLETALSTRIDRGHGQVTGACADGLLGDERVVLLGCAPGRSGFLAHAAAIGTCAPGWESAGLRVTIATRDPADRRRWAALIPIDPFLPSTRAGVVIVDQADRRTSAELAVLLDAAAGAKVLLVEGGTSLRLTNPASSVLRDLPGSVPRIEPGETVPWGVGGSAGFDPVRRLLDCWADLTRHDGRLLMVGLGVPEALALNDAARRHLASLGIADGPELTVGGRGYRAGDTVVTVRPAGPHLPAGTIGTVTRVDPERSVAMIRWPTHEAAADRLILGRIGHGYAATPRLASRTAADALVLGPADGIGIERHRILGCFQAARSAGRSLERDTGRALR